ncbi:unnamed protein product [Ilex paraguariensis]|uniref:1-phosphatidylinositol-3-phosphate 5-kinase n=1 Tax=Ilex paraguariensis TaxID=185542 RepID=A0ABC8TCQ9_9AQUA
MGIPDSSLSDLIEKVRSWISWGPTDLTSLSSGFEMANNRCKMCSECEMNLSESSFKYHCQNCGRPLCRNCIRGYVSLGAVASGDLNSLPEAGLEIKSCKFCSDLSLRHKGEGRYSDKIYPAESPRQSPEPPSPSFSGGDRCDGYPPQTATSSVTSITSHPSPVSVRRTSSRNDEDVGEESINQLYCPSSECCHEASDIDLSSVSARLEFYSFTSAGSSLSDSPSGIHIISDRVGHSVQREAGEAPRPQNDGSFKQETMDVLDMPQTATVDPENADDCADDILIFRDQFERLQKPLDFENNGLIWFPPPPEDEDDEAENSFFAYNDEDDEIGESGAIFSSSGSFDSMFPAKEKQNESHKEPLRTVVQGHFRALVSQLLQGEGIEAGRENSTEDWLDIVTTIAWQAADFVKPDTSGGGSMDPGDYVKVKCIASGSPGESTLVKGVVCTKNIKHKRMTSQYKNPRLLLLGGALEYQRVPNQLASFDTLLQQEIDHLKVIVSRIEAHRPNVLLVEKSVSSYAQEYLLAKEISLVLNVRRPLLERIARCTGAHITPSTDKISTTRLGHCELFRLEKMVEEHENANQFNKRPSKTLMFFEGCPRRLGCTVLLKGLCQEELKKVKNVVQYAVFAAYHLSLETSFLADEGASLPKLALKPSIAIPERTTADNAVSVIPNSILASSYQEIADIPEFKEGQTGLNLELAKQEMSFELQDADRYSSPTLSKCRVGVAFPDAPRCEIASNVALEDLRPAVLPSEMKDDILDESLETTGQGERRPRELFQVANIDEIEASSEYYSATDSHQSILVSFSCHCVLNGTVCERSRLLRIKFYGCFDKPLGRYLRDDLFDQTSCCRSCKEPAEAHVQCYTHQQGNLTINVRRLPSVKLPGERDGKIWMWHRCLRDCLRYYGFGSMVAFFRYSPINILSVCLPPSVLEFNGHVQQDWIRKEAAELLNKMETLYEEILGVLCSTEQKSTSFGHESSDISVLCTRIKELKNLLLKEKNEYNDLLQSADEKTSELGQGALDILELNRLRHSLLIGSHVWDRRLYSLDSLLKRSSGSEVTQDVASYAELKNGRSDASVEDGSLDYGNEENVPEISKLLKLSRKDLQSEQLEEPKASPSEPGVPEDSISNSHLHNKEEELYSDGAVNSTALERVPSAGTSLSDKIDSLWSGTDQLSLKTQFLKTLEADVPEAALLMQINQTDNPPFRKLMSPARVYSFDSALRIQDRIRKGLSPSSLHLSTLRSFHASGEYRNMIRDPVSIVQRTYSQMLPREAQKLNLPLSASLSFISSASLLPEGARFLLPQNGQINLVIAVYENEPTSIIAYALCCKEYEDRVVHKLNEHDVCTASEINKYNSIASNFSAWQSIGSLDSDYIHYGSLGSEETSTTIGTLFTDPKSSSHLRISFQDESNYAGEKVKFSVTCYFAKQFDALRKKCCPSELDFVRSFSRCKRWSAQGGKSNVYFAKSLDERFIIKQVTKTELESFEEFAPQYFKYLTDSLSSGSPTCLAKVLGIYQVTVKHGKGGKETKMDLMVMENLFFNRTISRLYDLKGSARSRYNSDPTGTNKVLLDMNLLETLRTKPIFLGSKAKRSLERAVWNDTSFLASVDVMDYSLLVGVDDERNELVLGIIDFMRQYTWDKHLETWVKASGILGGPKNASPTIISPKQYKKRFRKAMTTYFLTVPDQWSP